ncbi:2-hydroxychromene-2-carboxylate isomerase [Ferrovibrio sp.]|uniref:2-hydroxychromene-2-carboxylate isomerase n=1 Tax=Ferrovibrio sp. TaxID=1917215 RepID=UPI00311FC6CB
MTAVEFHFDFGSPNVYLCHKVIPAIEQRTGARFTYVPVLLGGIFKLTGNRSPIEAYAGIRNKLDYMQVETDRFIRRHGITTYRFNPHFPVNTLMLMRGAVAAGMEGVLIPYVEAMMRFMWEDPRKMDDPAVIGAALAESGLDAQRLFALAQSPEVKQRLADNTAASVERGSFGAPTFFVGDQIFFGKDRLDEVERAIREAAGR